MSVHQTDDGRWFVRFPAGKLPDRPKATREYFGRGDDAETRARLRNAELGLGKKLQAGSGRTFTDLTRYYLQSKADKIETSSVNTAFTHITKHLIPYFGNYDALEITDDRIDGYVARRRMAKWRTAGGRGKEMVGVSRSTVRREIATLQAVLNLAVKRKLIIYNPAASYDPPKEDDAVIKPATQNEIKAILRHAAPHLKRFIYLAYYTACRPGNTELLTMKWEQVDLHDESIWVVSAKKGGLDSRKLAIHPDLLKRLKQWHSEDSEMEPMPEYICHYNGEHISKIDRAWKHAKKKAKVLRRLRPYDIRHSAITEMLEAGKDLKSVSMIAGHKSPVMTMRKYQHASSKLRADAINGLVTLGNNQEEEKGSKGSTGA